MSTTTDERNAQNDLAELLQNTLDQLGLTQKQAGQRCNVSPTTVNKILRKRLLPTEDTMRALDRGLGTGNALTQLAGIARWGRAASRGVPPHRPPQVPLGPSPLLYRDDELSQLRDAITQHPVMILTGPPGAGKTAVARTLAHRATDTYHHGILDANLLDHHRRATDSATIQRRWLIRLGVDQAGIPADAENCRSMVHHMLTGRQVLMIVDDATDEDQVRSLLPDPICVPVLIISNRRLPGLHVRDGAKHHTLKPLNEQASVDLLTHLLGETEPHDTDALHEVAAQCDGLPLALTAAAELITTHGLPNAAGRLARSPLSALEDAAGPAGTGLPDAYHLAWQRLSPPAQHHLIACAQDDHPPRHFHTEAGRDIAGELRRENLLPANGSLGVLLRDWLHHHDAHHRAQRLSGSCGLALQAT